MSLSLVWMRRDLRLHDHAALATALAESGDVQPIFIFDRDILARFSNPSDRRLTFLAETLCHIHTELQKRGGGMLVLHGAARQILPTLTRGLSAARVVCAEDFEPAAISRDDAVKRALPSSTRFVQVIDHLLRAPHQVLKDDSTPYRIFTPYSKAWRSNITPIDYSEYEVNDTGRYALYSTQVKSAHAAGINVLDPSQGAAAMLDAIGYRHAPDALWAAHDAPARLDRFAAKKLQCYKDTRDFMAIDGTSALSPYIRFGLISIRECMRRAAPVEGIGAHTWINELIWRDFYAMILAHTPEIVEQEFQPQYRGLNWSHNMEHFQCFIEGKTGYPIIDAAMRQLLTEGWMHNRARMIVASFMTKDLQLDWRLGEEHFAQWLMDYDLASNNGGWQWAASTGTDAQPYFRIFNPLLQSQRFDESGDYIRRYVPELKRLNNKDIHEPKGLLRPSNYPQPIVDHKIAKDATLALFKSHRAA